MPFETSACSIVTREITCGYEKMYIRVIIVYPRFYVKQDGLSINPATISAIVN